MKRERMWIVLVTNLLIIRLDYHVLAIYDSTRLHNYFDVVKAKHWSENALTFD